MPIGQRHQCAIYEGSADVHLPALAATAKMMLALNHRCLYLNSPEMIAKMRFQLDSFGVDVTGAIEKGGLVLSSDQDHLIDQRFDVDAMLDSLDEMVIQSVRDGFAGLWASGDMAWEFGEEKNFSKLMEYEYRLEELFERQPALSGVCQYHCGTLPTEAIEWGLRTHRAVFINEQLSEVNPFYAPETLLTGWPPETPRIELKAMFARCA